MKIRDISLLLAILLIANSCVETPAYRVFKGYLNQTGFEVQSENIEVVFDEVLSLPTYQIRTIIHERDSLLITFSGLSFGPFQYILPSEGLNIATYYDASEGKYFSTHLTKGGFGEVELEKENGKISGKMDLIMYDQSGDDQVTITDITFHNLTVRDGNISRVSQFLTFNQSGNPHWSTSFIGKCYGSAIQVEAKFSKTSKLLIEFPEDLGPGVYPVGTGDVIFTMKDSLGYNKATGGEFHIFEHHNELNYVEAEFSIERNPILQQNQRFRLSEGKLRFVYYE